MYEPSTNFLLYFQAQTFVVLYTPGVGIICGFPPFFKFW